MIIDAAESSSSSSPSSPADPPSSSRRRRFGAACARRDAARRSASLCARSSALTLFSTANSTMSRGTPGSPGAGLAKRANCGALLSRRSADSAASWASNSAKPKCRERPCASQSTLTRRAPRQSRCRSTASSTEAARLRRLRRRGLTKKSGLASLRLVCVRETSRFRSSDAGTPVAAASPPGCVVASSGPGSSVVRRTPVAAADEALVGEGEVAPVVARGLLARLGGRLGVQRGGRRRGPCRVGGPGDRSSRDLRGSGEGEG
mmetsp:Transcript_8918/g.36841  ORF Transcript_8918/g.36841 Transcript_8918/m.36841 type:complete len:262 (-) Transcript_8918:90-875(-)